MKILAVPLASRVHSEDFYYRILDEYTRALKEFDDVKLYDHIVTDTKNLTLPPHDIIMFLHLTGGTSRLAKWYASRSGKPVILVAHSMHNSLASALSARSWLEARGFRTRIVYADPPSNLSRVLNPYYRGIKAAAELTKLKVLEVNRDGALSTDAQLFMEATNARVAALSYKEVYDAGLEATARDLDTLVSKIAGSAPIRAVDRGYLDRILRIYYGLKRIIGEKGFNAVSIDCFPFIEKYGFTPCIAVALLNNEGIPTACEADYYSLLALYISFKLTGRPGWIANPSGFTREGYVRFAHCTIAPGLCSRCMLVSHFETGRPYALACEIKHDRLLLIRPSLDYNEIHVYKARLVASGLLDEHYCRTQAILDLGPMNYMGFLKTAVGNHHVIIPWEDNIMESLETLTWLLGWRLVVHN